MSDEKPKPLTSQQYQFVIFVLSVMLILAGSYIIYHAGASDPFPLLPALAATIVGGVGALVTAILIISV